MHHELQRTSLCARSVVVLLGDAGKIYTPRQTRFFTRKPKR